MQIDSGAETPAGCSIFGVSPAFMALTARSSISVKECKANPS